MIPSPFTAEREGSKNEEILLLGGSIAIEESARLRDTLSLARPASLDLSRLEHLDGGCAAILAAALARWNQGREKVAVTGAAENIAAVLELNLGFTGAAEPLLPAPKRQNAIEQVGHATASLLDDLRAASEHVGRITLAMLAVVRRPRSLPWSSVGRLIERHGVDGTPIVALITFLVGMVSAFQASLQLKKFGADTLIADLVGLSITRELAPLMTAIVLAGRSGAAIAAELGTMRVSEEVDALTTMGLDPHRFLVLPRLIALVLVAPLLTLIADLVGVAGGVLVALATLEVTWQGLLGAIQEAVSLRDVFGGLAKAMIFGGLVALIACQRGLATRGGAEGVGRSTTSAVVACLFALVSADALFGVLFSMWGL